MRNASKRSKRASWYVWVLGILGIIEFATKPLISGGSDGLGLVTLIIRVSLKPILPEEILAGVLGVLFFVLSIGLICSLYLLYVLFIKKRPVTEKASHESE